MTSKQAVYISQASNGELASFTLDTEQATLTPTGRISLGSKVSTQSFLEKNNTLFVARSDLPSYYIETFRVDRHDGSLHQRHTVRVNTGTAYLFAEPSGRYLLSASYGQNCLLVYRVEDLQYDEAEPVSVIQDIPRAHAIITSHDSMFAYATSLKSDKVLAYTLDTNGQLSPIETIDLEAGFGPRHLVLSKDEKTLYVLSELDGRITSFRRDTKTGELGALTLSSYPSPLTHLKAGLPRPDASDNEQLEQETVKDWIWAADLHLTENPLRVIASERTSSQLLTYEEKDNNLLECVSATACPRQPRGFGIDATGKYLVATGELSNTIALYKLEERGDMPLIQEVKTNAGGNWISIILMDN